MNKLTHEHVHYEKHKHETKRFNVETKKGKTTKYCLLYEVNKSSYSITSNSLCITTRRRHQIP